MDYILKGLFKSNDDKTKIITSCDYFYSPDLITISYKESSEIGFENVITSINIYNKQKILISRKNNINTDIIVEPQKRNICLYETPFGTFAMGITGKFLNINLSPNGGLLKFGYLIDTNGLAASINETVFKITKKDN